jgi:dTDP-4-dehydrorhamnose reductase
MIWLIGNKGMLGDDVEELLKEQWFSYWSSDKEVDITYCKTLEKFGKDKKIEWVINCSGYTQVDQAEKEKGESFRINRDGVRNIALFCKKRQISLIHISTDYVFDGKKDMNEYYSEEDTPSPLGVYGQSKLAGEEEIKKLLNTYFIIRTAWLYGKNGFNFVNTMLRIFKERDLIKVVDDQYGSPTYTKDLAELILKIIKNESNQYGIYHFTNEGVTTWYKFAKEIYKQAKKVGSIEKNREVKIIPIKTEEYPTAVVRPKNSILSKGKTKKEFNIEIRSWNEALVEFIDSLPDRILS